MSFWLIALAMAVLALAWPLRALLRPREAPLPRAAHEVEALKAQIAEIGRDEGRGIISATEADSARVELSRRLIGADNAASREAATVGVRKGAPLLGVATGLAILISAGVVYLVIGDPGRRDQPLASRGPEGAMLAELGAQGGRLSQIQAQSLAEARNAVPRVPPPPAPPEGELDLPTLYERLRAAVAERPDDPQGLSLLAGFGARLGHFNESWPAYEKLAALTENPQAKADLLSRAVGAMVVAAAGYVSPEADKAMTTALEIAPESPAAEGLRRMRAEGPEDPRQALALGVALLERGMSAPSSAAGPSASGPRGPTAADIEAAASQTPEERAAMIEGMIAGLVARLEEEPQNLEGWVRIIMAYGVLGHEDQRVGAVEKARETFAGNPEALARIAQAERASEP